MSKPCGPSWSTHSVSLRANLKCEVERKKRRNFARNRAPRAGCLRVFGSRIREPPVSRDSGGSMRGFCAIESLPWGDSHARSVEDRVAAPRELEWLMVLTDALDLDTEQLVTSWNGSLG